MSYQSNIGNSVYTFDLNVFVDKEQFGSGGTGSAIPMDGLSYLEIVDNLANIGVYGKAVFNNSFNVLSDLGLNSGANKNPPLLTIKIVNNDFGGKNPDETSIIAVVQLQQSQEKTKNTVAKKLHYDFEESQICQLKQQNCDSGNSKLGNGTTISDVLMNTLTYGAGTGGIKGEVRTTGTPKAIPGIVTNGDTYYTAVEKYNKLLFNNDHGPGLVQLKNKSGKRVFTSSLIGETTKNLIRAVESNQSLATYVSETFTISPLESNKVDLRETKIQEYDLDRPNYTDLFAKKWLNYTLTQHSAKDININDNGVLLYDDLKLEFEKIVCGGKKSNLPTRNELTEKKDTLKYTAIPGQFPVEDGQNLNLIDVKCSTFRSFIFDNTAISFKVTGNTFRKPGMFIGINDFNKKGNDSELTGLWYVTSVRHIFEEALYTNEIIAVKFFTLTK